MKTVIAGTFLTLAWLACGPVGAQDEKLAKEMITKEAQVAIDEGLAYLAKQQMDDGSWGTRQYSKNVAITSFAGLAFLSAGHRPGQGPYGDVVAKAVDYVLKRGEEKHFRAPAGFFLQDRSIQSPMYSHGYAVLFLAEAHAVVKGDKHKEIKEALTRGVKIIADAQNKDGGWRYWPEPRDADLSVAACQLHALFAAMKAGVEVPEETLDKAIRYVRSCHDAKGGFFRYQPQGSKGMSSFVLTAAALSTLTLAKAGEDEPWKGGLAYLKATQGANTGRDKPHHFYYGQFYAASAMQRIGGKDWRAWYPVIRDALLIPPTAQGTTRGKDGNWTGGGMCPHFNTALAVLILQSPDSRLGIAGK